MSERSLPIVLLLSLVLTVPPVRSSDEEPRASMKEQTVRNTYAWSAFIHVARAKNYLNYNGSTLKPVTKVSITLRQGKGPTELYEELFYHDGKALGMHRKNVGFVRPDQAEVGTIILGGELTSAADFPVAAVNALARLLIDFQLRRLVPAAVVVPRSAYESVFAEMQHYGFRVRQTLPTDGPQYSIVLRSVPAAEEAHLFLNSK